MLTALLQTMGTFLIRLYESDASTPAPDGQTRLVSWRIQSKVVSTTSMQRTPRPRIGQSLMSPGSDGQFSDLEALPQLTLGSAPPTPSNARLRSDDARVTQRSASMAVTVEQAMAMLEPKTF
jgi:hypothetical protein